MARYIITNTQFHSLVYKYLDNLIVETLKTNPWGGTDKDKGYSLEMYDKNGKVIIKYIFYGPELNYDDPDDTNHNGIGSIIVHPKVIDFIRTTFNLRETRAKDILADWVTSKIDTDVDEVSIHPQRDTPPVY